jgi:hypothetical protein
MKEGVVAIFAATSAGISNTLNHHHHTTHKKACSALQEWYPLLISSNLSETIPIRTECRRLTTEKIGAFLNNRVARHAMRGPSLACGAVRVATLFGTVAVIAKKLTTSSVIKQFA